MGGTIPCTRVLKCLKSWLRINPSMNQQVAVSMVPATLTCCERRSLVGCLQIPALTFLSDGVWLGFVA